MFTLNLQGEKWMVLNISEPAADAALNVIAAMAGGGALELLDVGDELLCSLQLSDPAAQDAIDGELMFAPIDVGVAVAGGQAATGRIIGPTGVEILTCDIGDETSDATIKLNSTRIAAGAAVSISSFTLSMP